MHTVDWLRANNLDSALITVHGTGFDFGSKDTIKERVKMAD